MTYLVEAVSVNVRMTIIVPEPVVPVSTAAAYILYDTPVVAVNHFGVFDPAAKACLPASLVNLNWPARFRHDIDIVHNVCSTRFGNSRAASWPARTAYNRSS